MALIYVRQAKCFPGVELARRVLETLAQGSLASRAATMRHSNFREIERMAFAGFTRRELQVIGLRAKGLLGSDRGTQLRASMQCQVHRVNGGTFVADVWFSTYTENDGPKLAAIIADVTEEHPM